ncbi:MULTISPECIES: leucyl/phenylalanyl-tRNA--protein transferase [Deefgea]|uniref:Leucyl/phenylalanyl-tRNA--protein transferase n=1 Tax=Deefgea chitinilytica TaxID=570276 RepID=A0ABS2CA69_9NEIS|nr:MULTISPECIES: leucyl/phenylalanyl-tRNA--protein transferase [Deefgea]MBM5571036.1 leucyl/phenylalanyl-tRNA--protein transferase [Deefgea chitinilytica]MBM9888266.1 leucyl/phenylalanyl-tRNA--protein transferase [Deefgea sp. CFH1-16]
MIPWLDHRHVFPPLTQALKEPNGLLVAGGDLSPQRILAAYRQGIFPWFMPGEPILWWSPSPRMVLYVDEFKVPKSLVKVVRHRRYQITFDTAFEQVMQGCAAPRGTEAGTWISDEMLAAYTALHEAGFAHSFECWMDGELVGGLYGMALGKMFYGESMFARRSDASKIAFVHAVQWLRANGFAMIDCQMYTDHLARFGAREIDRDEFVAKLKVLLDEPEQLGPWQYCHINE